MKIAYCFRYIMVNTQNISDPKLVLPPETVEKGQPNFSLIWRINITKIY